MWSWSRPFEFFFAFTQWWWNECCALMPGHFATSGETLPKRRVVIAPNERFVQISLQADDQTTLFVEEITWADYSRDGLNGLLARAKALSEPYRYAVSLAFSHCVAQKILVPQKASAQAFDIICDEVRRKTPVKLEELFIGYHVELLPAGKAELRYLVAPRTLLDRLMTQLHLTDADLSHLETVPAAGERPAAVAYRPSGRGADLFRNTGMALAAVAVVSLCLAAAIVYSRQAARIAEMTAIADRLAGQSRQSGDRAKSLMDSMDDARRLAVARQAPGTVAIWSEVTRALPDSTYLTELVVDESSVKLSGFSDSVADVMAALEASSLFSHPTLSGPMTRQPESRKQSFTLVAGLRQLRIPDGGRE